MTRLRKRMLEELQRRNYAQSTIEAYLHGVEDFARHFGKSPELLNQEHIRQYQLYLANDRKLAVNTIIARIAGQDAVVVFGKALRFRQCLRAAS